MVLKLLVLSLLVLKDAFELLKALILTTSVLLKSMFIVGPLALSLLRVLELILKHLVQLMQ